MDDITSIIQMKNQPATHDLPLITDHNITLFYFFNKHVDLGRLDSKTLIIDGLPKRIKQQIENQLKTRNLWKKQAYNITRDIKENIHELFHSKQESAPITTWELNKLVIKLLNDKQASKEKGARQAQEDYAISGLALELSKVAQKRLVSSNEPDTSPQLSLQNILYHQFKTGFAVATIELSVNNKKLSLQLINEAVYALARFNKLIWRSRQGEIEDQNQYSLGDLIRGLLASEKNKFYKRVYTHSYIQFKESAIEDVKEYLNKIARHYNDEYNLSNETKSIESIQGYNNVIHFLAQEGASTGVIVTEDSPEYLLEYTNKVIRPVHIPIHLLIFHAEKAMEEYQINSQIWLNDSAPPSAFLDQLQQYQRQLINFELNFFYPVISNIDMHNRLYLKLIKVKRLEQQHKKLSNNNKIISQIIIENEQQKASAIINNRNRIYCQIAQIGVAAAGYLTSFSIIKETLKVIKGEDWWGNACPILISYLDHHSGVISLVGASVIAVVVYLFTWHRCACAETHNKDTPVEHVDHINHLLHFLHGGKSH
jgi:hypothetical protein